MTPGKGFLVALVALVGGILIYLAVTGRYGAAGLALRSIPVIPGGASWQSLGATTDTANRQQSGSEPGAPIPSEPTNSNAGTSASPAAGRQPPFGG